MIVRGWWIVGIVACVAVSASVWISVSRVPENAPDQVEKVADASLVQTALQAQLPPKGFDWARVAQVEEIHAHIVATLDDLDATNGIRRIKTA